ncbi:MAG: M14 family zinc carboxypeptidase [Gammaproteobacteria bacterium]|nr:M14 family zinc carboxypeptidase [Gammaproteobacteria bacterium]
MRHRKASLISSLLALAMTAMPGISLASDGSATGPAMIPNAGEHDSAIPAPRDVFGFETGAQHVRHDQLVEYFETLAESSDRVMLEETGRTHEGRKQLLAIISTPENLANIDNIREQHLAAVRGEAGARDGKVVLWQGYSIHGDESSGSNAAPLYAWHLAASKDPQVAKMLEDVIVLIDPSLNPDGMGRYAAWNTSRRSEVPVTDENHAEHDQAWPTGRGNHYWFDLNRDWLLLQHPESRARVEVMNRWRPHVFTDHHEMGKDSTYFFQPGVPERTNPLTPSRNQELTGLIAEFHAKHLDREGRLYYTEESFDDFYYGKGSTYPDINGGVGILFEQASTDGQAIETPFGVRPFSKSVQNQLITSISTLDAAYNLRNELRDYQAGFFADARDEADGAWVVGNAGNPARMQAFLKLLAGHGIRFRPLEERLIRNGQEFQPGQAWVIPAEQEQARLIEAMFEMRTQFPSNIFYDVSAWTLPLAFDLPFAQLTGMPNVGAWHDAAPSIEGSFSPELDAVAYAFRWNSDHAARALQSLLADGIIAMAATDTLAAKTPKGELSLDRGSIVVPIGVQSNRRGDIVKHLSRAAKEFGIDVHAISSGLTPRGIDIGSPSLEVLEPIKPLLVIGNGMNPYEAGEFWYMADTRIGLPVTHVRRDDLSRVDLGDYTHVVMVGHWGGLDDSLADKLHGWVKSGGVLVAQQNSAEWVTEKGLHMSSRDAEKETEEEEKETSPRRNYEDFRQDYAKTLISGTIFASDVDTSHPLAYGIADRNLPVFKDREETLAVSDNPYETVAQFTSDPLLAGYVSAERLAEVSGTAAVVADRVGSGLVVRYSFDPLFRGFWHGSQRLMVNTLFFSQLVGQTPEN